MGRPTIRFVGERKGHLEIVGIIPMMKNTLTQEAFLEHVSLIHKHSKGKQ